MLLNSDDKALWSMALNDVNNDLCLSNYANISEIVGTLIQILSSLNCEVIFSITFCFLQHASAERNQKRLYVLYFNFFATIRSYSRT